ncbi:MAG: tetratricopeptide repeat protein [Chloracidobacterium sp.]|nr:tetratricopeptide repeat protein [Chloracidobacterium sp.]MDW8217426.1 tetratricopeptide repeat protein [Acidobacteriota bacterium]
MKRLQKNLLAVWVTGLFVLQLAVGAAQAQEFADFGLVRSEIRVTLRPADYSADVTALLELTNIAKQAEARTLTLRLTKAAKVTAFTVNDRSMPTDEKKQPGTDTAIAAYVAELSPPLPPGGKVTAQLVYSLTYRESTNYAALTPGDSLLLPEAGWTPFIHLPQSSYGPDTAPYVLTVTRPADGEVWSSGVRQEVGEHVVFTSTLAGSPWLVVQPFATLVSRRFSPAAGAPTVIAVYGAQGLPEKSARNAERLAEEVERMLLFYQALWGEVPIREFRVLTTPRRIVADRRSPELRGRDFDTDRAIRHAAPGAALMETATLLRPALDAETIEWLTAAVAQTWLGGKVRLRGRGWTVLADALPAYLTSQYIQQHYGAAAERDFWLRRSFAYSRLANVRVSQQGFERGIDAIPLLQHPTFPDYYVSVPNRGALVFRLLERLVGRDTLLGAVKATVGDASGTATYDTFRARLVGTPPDERRASFFRQWFEELSEPDFVVGIPVKREDGPGWRCALRNLGTGDAVLPVVALTDKGEKLTAIVEVPSKGYGTAVFETTATIVEVELDPEKLYPQVRFGYDRNSKQFDNDARPERRHAFSLLLDAEATLTRRLKADETEAQRQAEAERLLREAVTREPGLALAHAYLARTLVAQGKLDAAQEAVAAVRRANPPSRYPLALALLTEGDLAAARKEHDRARAAYKTAFEMEAGPTLDEQARRGLLASENAAGRSFPPDDEIRAFLSTMDKAIRASTSKALESCFIRPDTSKFVLGIVVSKPDSWTTQAFRMERLDAQRVLLDVNVAVVSATKEAQAGTGLLTLRRVGAGWMVERLDQFVLSKR